MQDATRGPGGHVEATPLTGHYVPYLGLQRTWVSYRRTQLQNLSQLSRSPKSQDLLPRASDSSQDTYVQPELRMADLRIDVHILHITLPRSLHLQSFRLHQFQSVHLRKLA